MRERSEQDAGSRAVVDRDGTAPGRGAYLCREQGAEGPAPECLRLALKRGGIQRTLRAPVAVDPEIVESVS